MCLFGIESPGLTATLAIAEDVRMALSSSPWRQAADIDTAVKYWMDYQRRLG